MLSIISLVRLRIRQAIAGDKPRGLLKFLLPDVLVGFLLAISSGGTAAGLFQFRVVMVATSVALFTLLAETRKFFFSGGDMESFYFVQPTTLSRLASFSGILFLDMAIVAAIFASVIIILPLGRSDFLQVLAWLSLAVSLSVSLYVLLISLIAFLPGKSANRALTLLQLLMALALLAVFQLSAQVEWPVVFERSVPVSVGLLAVTAILFMSFPLSENLISSLNENGATSAGDLFALTERLKKIVLIRSDEEEAGFMFFLANLFRNSSFRLSTIGIAGTPVMVAVYWSMRGARFLTFDLFQGLVNANFVAPIASLVVSGIVVYYFLSENVLSSRDHEARWQFETQGDFSVGQFVLGVRKALLATIHVPVTILIFLVLMIGNSFLVSLITALTFYSMSHVALSWFSIMQKRIPFSLPFTQIGATEIVNLLSMLIYSFATTVLLFIVYGDLHTLLAVNLFAFILVGVLEHLSPRIVNKRVRLHA